MPTKNQIPPLYARVLALHRDQQGSISITSVFAILLMVMLFGMVLNSGRQVDQRVKMQNAADAATYSGSVVISRGMNTLAFTNHLLCDVFALTAFMREARDRDADVLADEILDNWARIGPQFAKAHQAEFGGFKKFGDLGIAITDKVPHERETVLRFSEWASAASELMLPVFEEILRQEQIPEFQHALIRTTPQLAQIAADEVAQRHGNEWPQPTTLRCVLWRSDGSPLFEGEAEDVRWMPVVDPARDDLPNVDVYMAQAQQQRFELSHTYLRWWNDESLPLFDAYGQMSQFSSLWRIFTGGHLQVLLEEEYPHTNLPMQILTRDDHIANLNEHLEYRYMLVGVAYRKRISDEMPGIFQNPVPFDTRAYAQAMVYVPKRRLVKMRSPGGGVFSDDRLAHTGVPGQNLPILRPRSGSTPPPPPTSGSPGEEEDEFRVMRQWFSKHPDEWSLISQNWSCQLVPATCPQLPGILSQPSLGYGGGANPHLETLTDEDLRWLSNH